MLVVLLLLVQEVPRIESVEMVHPQPHARDSAVIWYDDFSEEKTYTEASGKIDSKEGFGRKNGAMPCIYEKGSKGKGGRKVFFGDGPYKPVARKGEKFEEIYWRIYVKHQRGWTGGGPAKMSRATSIVSPRWNQAMIAHVWSSGESLTLDHVRGVRGGRVVTTKYNDFANFKWVGGNKPVSKFKIHSTGESGWWICVEARARLNSPGKADAESELWIDGRLEAERKQYDWRGTYTGHGINAVFLEAYWNKGSPVDQKRWYDNFVISTKPIGPVVTPRIPTLFKTPYEGPGRLAEWEVEVAEGKRVVWRKTVKGKESVKVDRALPPDKVLRCRARQKSSEGGWSEWSSWHQAFRTAKR